MRNTINHTSNPSHFPCQLALISLLLWDLSSNAAQHPLTDAYDEDQIEIIEGEDRIIYEFRQNGILTMIKIVPKKGRSYYLVPADGAPIYEGLDHKRKLYPQWVVVEW